MVNSISAISPRTSCSSPVSFTRTRIPARREIRGSACCALDVGCRAVLHSVQPMDRTVYAVLVLASVLPPSPSLFSRVDSATREPEDRSAGHSHQLDRFATACPASFLSACGKGSCRPPGHHAMPPCVFRWDPARKAMRGLQICGATVVKLQVTRKRVS